jgi:hypothetical protein
LRSWMVALIFSPSLSRCWTCWSSSSFVHSCAYLSNKSPTALTCSYISSICLNASRFLCSFTSGGVVGMSCS